MTTQLAEFSFKHSKAETESQWLPDSPSRRVVFRLWISPRIRSQNRNGSKGSVRDLWGTNFSKIPRKSASLPCPFNMYLATSRQVSSPSARRMFICTNIGRTGPRRGWAHWLVFFYIRDRTDCGGMGLSGLGCNVRNGTELKRDEAGLDWVDWKVAGREYKEKEVAGPTGWDVHSKRVSRVSRLQPGYH